eukprot:TRINITY_DN4296_c0_g1_i2.p1 TRINITY_DN4296_c0_g1~~TRINITY_DN4296_c0_g1_i2.p1  ORF type:complete len:556 (-),score=60.81 TRINITY_DN4296_c0_g1_i2:93-1760(-)
MEQPVEYDVRIEEGVAMQTRDGVTLMSDVYRPVARKALERFPVILIRTPYGKKFDRAHTEHLYLPQQGYIVVCQDVRGRNTSEGTWWPAKQEAEDGYDAIEWAAKLPRSNGHVGTCGQSYLGLAQVWAASLKPPSLKAMVLISAPNSFDSVFYRGNIFMVEWATRYFNTMSHDFLKRLNYEESSTLLDSFFDKPFYHGIAKMGLNAMGKSDLQTFMSFNYKLKPEIINETSRENIAGRFPSACKYIEKAFKLSPDDPNDDIWGDKLVDKGLEAIASIPTFHVTSWYDCFLEQSLKTYIICNAVNKHIHKLLVGPWGHLLPYTKPTQESGDIDFGPSASIDLHKMELEWFDKFLKGKDNDSKINAETFLMGKNEWMESECFPSRQESTSYYYLGAKVLTTDFGDALKGSEYTTYVDDVNNPVPSLGGNVATLDMGPKNQASLLNHEGVAYFKTPQYLLGFTIHGYTKVELFVSTEEDGIDSIDIFTKLVVVDNKSNYYQNISEGCQRETLSGHVTVHYRTWVRIYESQFYYWRWMMIIISLSTLSDETLKKNNERN